MNFFPPYRFFEQMSSIKTRKHYVIFDMAFSGLWALFYFVAFIYMANSWRQSDEMFNFAKSNVIGAIFFAFLSILTWVSSWERKFEMGRGDFTLCLLCAARILLLRVFFSPMTLWPLQLASVGLAYQRFKAGSSAAFQQGFDDAEGAVQDYQGGPEDMGGTYGEQPFQGGAQSGRFTHLHANQQNSSTYGSLME